MTQAQLSPTQMDFSFLLTPYKVSLTFLGVRMVQFEDGSKYELNSLAKVFVSSLMTKVLDKESIASTMFDRMREILLVSNTLLKCSIPGVLCRLREIRPYCTHCFPGHQEYLLYGTSFSDNPKDFFFGKNVPLGLESVTKIE